MTGMISALQRALWGISTEDLANRRDFAQRELLPSIMELRGMAGAPSNQAQSMPSVQSGLNINLPASEPMTQSKMEQALSRTQLYPDVTERSLMQPYMERLSKIQQDRGSYSTPQTVVGDGKHGLIKDVVYEVPYDTRNKQWLYELAAVSPQTPEAVYKNAFSKKGGEVEGESVTTAKINLPTLKHAANTYMGLIDKAIKHPGFQGVVGAPGVGKVKALISGTDEADFRALQQQLEGKAFLDIRKELKGAGQISDFEMKGAMAAHNRMKTAVSEQAYLEAADELKQELVTLYQLAEQKAQMGGTTKNKIPTVSTQQQFDQLPSGAEYYEDGQLYRKP